MSLLTEKNDPQAKCQDSSGLTCEFSQNLDILRQVDLFSGLPIEGLKVFALMCSRERYKAGDYLFNQSEDDGQAFYIHSGKAELTYKDQGEEIVVREVSAGELMGMLALLGDEPRLYSLRATTDMECFLMERDKFRSTLVQFPEIMPKLIKALVQKIYNRERGLITSRNPDCESCKKNLGVVFA